MRIRLSGGAYKARSILASAQRQVNLFSEKPQPGAIVDLGDQDVPIPVLYPAPGLTALATPPAAGAARGLYWANSETLFYACGNTLYNVRSDWSMAVVGTILSTATTPVSMADNGQDMVLVDGTGSGYQIDLGTLAFTTINGTPYPAGNAPTLASTAVYGFYGADKVVMLDGFLLFNQPATANFYSTYNNEVVFDSLYIAAKDSYADHVVSIAVNQKVIWLIGERTTEVWFDAGAADFPFAEMPGPFVQHGCIAKYSIAQIDEAVFWLSQDQTGAGIAVRTQGYSAVRISTHAIETRWSTYSTIADAVAFTFQQAGHRFYQINFPTADRSWRYDLATDEWHEAVWTDTNGAEHRHRAQCAVYAYGQVVCADWQTGALYALDPAAFSDVGQPILRRRDFPHMVADGNRIFYRNFLLDIAPGNSIGTSSDQTPIPVGFSSDYGSDFAGLSTAVPADTSPQVLLRWSDDHGRTFGNPITGSLGATGEYLTSVQYNRLGFARDRVFSVEWSDPVDSALQGAFLTFDKGSS